MVEPGPGTGEATAPPRPSPEEARPGPAGPPREAPGPPGGSESRVWAGVYYVTYWGFGGERCSGPQKAGRAHAIRPDLQAGIAARPDVCRDAARLARPVGEPADEGRRLQVVPAEAAGQPRVVALLEDAHPQRLPPPGSQRRSVSPCPRR